MLQELDKPGSVEPTLLGVLINLAAIDGDAALYDRYLAKSKAATDPEERYQYLYGLTSFANPALVRRTMDLALSDAGPLAGREARDRAACSPTAIPSAWPGS